MDIKSKIIQLEELSLSLTPAGTDTRVDINTVKDIISHLRKTESELQELRLQKITEFGEIQTLCENADDAWEEYVGRFDTFSSQWQDKGCDDIYKDGFKAGVLSVCSNG